MFKFVNLEPLQEFCQTYFFNFSLKLWLGIWVSVQVYCLILLGSSLNISFASSMNVDLFIFLSFVMIIGKLYLNARVGFLLQVLNLQASFLCLFHYMLVTVSMNLFILLAVAI